MVKITKKLIATLIQDVHKFIEENSLETIISIVKYAAKKYYNGEGIISDTIYDLLFDIIKKRDPTNDVLKQVGAPVHVKDKEQLPYFMGSMDKIKPDIKNFTWINTYKGPYVYSDKLDGISGLLVNKDGKLQLYKRGDGYEGTNISKLIPYIGSIKNIPDDYAVRGELIISKTNFELFKDKYKNGRNMVGGLTGSKSLDISIIKYIDFVSYELINPWIPNQIEQFNELKKLGFNIVHFNKLPNLTFEKLSQILKKRKVDSDYEVDGIIVSNENLPQERPIGENPQYAFAYKDEELMESAIIEVLNVEWNISKDGYIKPTLSLVPTNLAGVTISNVTAFNAKFVVDNKLGPGAIIRLIRSGDVIPDIQEVIIPAQTPQLPIDIDYKWSSSGVDIITKHKTTEQKIKELIFFFKTLNIKNIDESTVKKMYEVGIDTIQKIMIVTKEDLSKIKGFQEKSVSRIYNAIKERLASLNILDLMIASNVFGHGIGEKKLGIIMEVYPNIIQLFKTNTHNSIIEKIIEIKGFDTKTATLFAHGFGKFIQLYKSLNKDMRAQLKQSIKLFEKHNNNSPKFDNKIFVFSGFRNSDWEKLIIENGGKVTNSVSKNTNYLITKNNANTSKVSTAKSLGIIIMTKDEFENYIKN